MTEAVSETPQYNPEVENPVISFFRGHDRLTRKLAFAAGIATLAVGAQSPSVVDAKKGCSYFFADGQYHVTEVNGGGKTKQSTTSDFNKVPKDCQQI